MTRTLRVSIKAPIQMGIALLTKHKARPVLAGATGLFTVNKNLPAHHTILPLPVMASSSKGKGVETSSARLRKRLDHGSSHPGSVSSDNNQSDEHVAEVYQSPVSAVYPNQSFLVEY
jgi:hypothetical protein